MTIHFICRGNVLRSLIAEAYLASQNITGITVTSSGTVAAANRDANLPNYQQTVTLLRSHGLQEFTKTHYGEQVTQTAVAKADIIVCMNPVVAHECAEAGIHLPADAIVWNVDDVDEGTRKLSPTRPRESYLEEIYTEITSNVSDLAKTLA